MDDNARVPLPSDAKLPAVAPPEADGAAWTAGRRWGTWINMAAMIALAVGILVAVNYLAARRFVRYDMTAGQEYRVTDRARTLLAGLKVPVVFYPVFLSPDLTYDEADAKGRLENVLDEFKHISPFVGTEPLNYGMGQSQLLSKMKALKLNVGLTDRSVIVAANDRSKVINLSSMYDLDYGSRGAARIKTFKGERLLIAAVLELTGEAPPVVYYAKGHGAEEGRMERGREPGLSWIVNRLKERENIDFRSVDLTAAQAIPDECKVLVIHRPATPYVEREILLLRDFLQRGGRLCVMAEAMDAKGFIDTGLDGLLGAWGLLLGRNVVVGSLRTPQGGVLTDQPVVQAGDFGSHPIVNKLKENQLQCGLGLTRTVTRTDGADPRILATPLITLASPTWWGETSMAQMASRRPRPDGEDAKPPLDLAQAVRVPVPAETQRPISPETRLVVFGGDFISDRMAPMAQNEDLYAATLLWLIDREQNIGIGDRDITDRRVTLDLPRRQVVFWVSVVGLPLVAILAGFGLWFVRRK
jgi:hypothetical protein